MPKAGSGYGQRGFASRAATPMPKLPKPPSQGYGFGQSNFGIRANTPVSQVSQVSRPPAVQPHLSPGQGSGPGGAVTIDDLVKQITQPEIDFYNQQRAALTARQAAQQQAYQGFTNSLLQYLSGLPSGIDQTYGKAVADTSALGQAAAQGLINANPNGAAVANLQAINAPQSQINAVTQQNADVFGGGGGVLNYVGGALPAETLAADRAANVAFAQALPGIQSMSAARGFNALLGSQAQQQSAIDQALAQIQSQGRTQAYSIQNQLSQQKLATQKFNSEQAYRDAQLGLSQQRLNQSGQLGYARLNQQGQIASARLGQGNQSLQLRQLQGDRNWQLGLARLGIAEKGLQLRTAQSQAKLNGGGYTRAQMIQLQNRAGKIATSAYNGTTSGTQGIRVTTSDGTVGHVPLGTTAAQLKAAGYTPVTDASGNTKIDRVNTPHHLSYQQAMRQGLAAGIPLTVMQNALNKYWSKPGQQMPWDNQNGPLGGRPMQSYQQRQAAAGRRTPPFQVDTGGRPVSPEAQRAIHIAEQYMGTPYKWGGASPTTGFDCSGLLQYACKQAGITIPRTSQEQWRSGRPVALNQLQPGDAVFFVGSDGTRTAPGHVGIYVGNGEYIQAPHTGDVVKISRLADATDYVGARRYF